MAITRAQQIINMLRKKSLNNAQFRETAYKIAKILAEKALTNLDTKTHVTIVPILRSGLALLPTFLKKFPNATVGFVGIKRNEQTAEPIIYYKNIPPINSNSQVIILDPMLATGGSASATITLVKEMGVSEEHIIFVSIISAPEGTAKLSRDFPKIKIIVGVQDQGLTPNKFITPGLGDFGDRFFGTE